MNFPEGKWAKFLNAERSHGGWRRSAVHDRVNGRLTEAPEGARWSLNGGAAAGRAAAEVGARA